MLIEPLWIIESNLTTKKKHGELKTVLAGNQLTGP